MLDINRTMFYKVKFDITAAEGVDVLWSLICNIRRWVVRKSHRGGYEITDETRDWTAFKRGSVIKANGADVDLRSCLHIDGNVFTWACQYRENIVMERDVAPRQWVTEIGFEGRSINEGVLSIVLSYGDRPGYIGPLQPEPKPSIPNLVKIMLEDKTLECTVSGYDVKESSIEVTQENAQKVFEMISNPDREVPVVLVTYREAWKDGGCQVDPTALRDLLGPNAIICYTKDATALQTINNLLVPYDLNCFAGSVRIYSISPNVNQAGEAARHRYIPYGDIERKGQFYAYEILRRALAQDINFWDDMLRIDDVRRLNRESDHEKRIASLKERFQDEALEEMIRTEDRAEAAEQERDRLQEEFQETTCRNNELEAQCTNLQEALMRKRSTESAHEIISAIESMEKMPPSLSQVAKLVVSMHPGKIDFTERGWGSLGDSHTAPQVFYEALVDMHSKLRPLFMDDFKGDIEKEFNSNSHFQLARGEGSSTRKDKKLMSERKDTYQGRELTMERHIKSSTGDPSDCRFLRIYFDWDDHSKKIIIGDCAGHKTTAGTRRKK